MSDRDNYYMLLDIAPNVQDESVIEWAIREKQELWSRERNIPTKGVAAKQNLGRLNDIRAVMLDPLKRDAEARGAMEILQRKRNKLLERVEQYNLVENGEISQKSLSALAKMFKDDFASEAEILKALNVAVRKEHTAIRDKNDGVRPLEDSVAKTIRENLNVLKKKSLFDFLGCPPAAAVSILLEKAEVVYNEASRNANKTAQVTAAIFLAGGCRNWFKDAGTKESYQKTLTLEALKELDGHLILAGDDGVISYSEFQHLIGISRDYGVPDDEAVAHMREYCNREGISLQIEAWDAWNRERERQRQYQQEQQYQQTQQSGELEDWEQELRRGKKKRPAAAAAAAIGVICVISVIAALAARPNPDRLFDEGMAYFNSGNNTAAIASFTKAIDARPREAKFLYQRGEAYLKKEDYYNAVTDYSDAIRLDPNSAPSRYGRASAYYYLKDYDRAMSDYSEAIRLNPNAARYHNSRGNLNRIKGNYDAAITDHSAAIRLNPDDARYHNNRGVAYHLKKDYRNAIQNYSEAIRLAPNDARYRNSRGSVYNLLKDFAAAAADFNQALRLEPGNSEYQKNLDKTMADAMKGGSLTNGRSRASVQRVVMQNMAALRHAYSRRLRDKPGLSGTVTVKFAIDEFGRVIYTQLTSSTLNDSELETTVVSRVRSWIFDKIDKPGDVTQVTYPFTFSQ